jgi:hypothetical protein
LKEELQRLWRKPALDVTVQAQPPDCHIGKTIYSDPKTGTVLGEGDCCYLRLWVHNNQGNLPATNVEVFVSRLFFETVSRKFVQADNFLPMNLRWAHTKEIFRSRIAPKMGRHCDLGI